VNALKAAKDRPLPKPLIITVSHRLGRDEAKRRLEGGLGHIRGQLAAFVSSLNYSWAAYQLDFSITAGRQSINGDIDVEDDIVRVEITLPLLLRMLTSQITSRVHREAALLLGNRGR
jgi:hypothetical protein